MGPAAILNILITANNAQAMQNIAQTEAGMKKLAGTAASSANATAASYARTGQKLQTVGKSLTRYLAIPAAAAGVVSVKMAKDFDESMTHVQTLAGTSSKTMERFRNEVLKMAPAVGKSPQELAEALYFIRSSGIKAADSMEVLRQTAMASAVGLGETKTVADAVTSAMNAYRRSNLSAKDAVEVLMKTVKFGKAEPEELAASIGRVIPVASKLGVSFADVGASLAGLTLQGLDSAEATTALRGVFMALLKPSQAGNEALAKVHLTTQKLKDVLAQPGGTLKMLELLSTRFKGNEDAMAAVFPNVRALVGAFNLTGDSVKKNAQIFREMNRDTDFLGRQFKATSETDAFKFRQAMASLQVTAIKLGNVLLPVVSKIAGAFAKLIAIFPPGGLAVLIGAALVIGPIVRLIGFVYRLRAAWLLSRDAALAAGAAQAAAGTAGGAGAAGGMAATVAKWGAVAAAAAAAGYAIQEGAIKLGQALSSLSGGATQFGLGEALALRVDESIKLVHIEKSLRTELAGIQTGEIAITAQKRQQVNQAVDLLFANQKITREQAYQLKHAMTLQGILSQVRGIGVGPLQQYGADVVKLASLVVSQLSKIPPAAKSMQARVGDSFSILVGIWRSGFNKIAGITNKDMAQIILAMQRGPEQGRQAIKNTFDKMVGNIRTAMSNGKITVSQGVRKIMNILKMEAEALGIPYRPLSWLPSAEQAMPFHPQKPQKGAIVVPGQGSGDHVPILAEPGEVVLNRSAVQAMGGAQRANRINKMFPRFAKGGQIPTYPASVVPGFVDNIALGAVNRGGNAARMWLAQKKAAMGGRGGMGGGSATWRAIDALAAQWGLSISSGFRPGSITSSGNLSYHAQRGPGGRSRATDYADSPHAMLVFARKMSKRYGHNLAELIHTPLGYSIKNGSRTAPIAAGDHYSHVHVAMQKGGVIVKGKTSTFGPPMEAAGTTASGVSSSKPGIALYRHDTLGKLFKVRIGSHLARLTQTDFGPAPWTGRKIDVTGAGAQRMGINPRRFPTDAFGVARQIMEIAKEKPLRKSKGKSAEWSLALPQKLQDQITGLAAEADKYADFASRASTLENLVGGKDEIGWLRQELETLATLRNALLTAREWILTIIARYQEAIAKAKNQIAKLKDHWGALSPAMKAARRPKIKALQDQINKWTTRRDTATALLNDSENGPLGKLTELQGYVTDPAAEFRKGALPAVGVLGGRIFDVQSALQQAQANTSATGEDVTGADNSAMIALLQEQADKLAKQLFVSEQSYKVLAQTPYAGAFARGGVVPGPTGAPRMAMVHGGERISPVGAPQPIVVIVQDGAVNPNYIRAVSGQQAEQLARRAGRGRVPGIPGAMA